MLSLPDHPFFQRPTRVSRLFPVLFVACAMAGSGFLYRWQLTTINADTAVQARDKQIEQLTGQVTLLSAQQREDQAQLRDQRQRLDEASTKLADIEKQLTDKTASLDEATRQLADADARLKQQQDQLSQNASELENLRKRPPLFSFQNQTGQDLDGAEADIKAVVSSAYDYIQDLYGAPYLLNQITITFVDGFSISGSAGEIVIENGPKGIAIDIHLKDFDKTDFQDVNTLIHEIVHGFHGVAVFEHSALEEGITVAVTDAVMERMMDDGTLQRFPHLYLTLTDAQYQDWNHSLSVLADNDAFYQYQDVSKVYQLIGKAWFNLYRADPQVFKKLNDTYYPHIQRGEKGTDSLALASLRQVIGSVNGTPIDTYLAQNKAFNPR